MLQRTVMRFMRPSRAPMSATSAQIELCKYKYHKLEPSLPTTATLTADEARKMYFDMKIIRLMENTCTKLYQERVIRGFCHLYSGQEAMCVGLKAAMQPQDSAITAYRAHGWTYVMGVSVEGILSELAGRKTGCSGGKGGSMHTYAPNFYGGNGIVGAQVPLGGGIAFAHKYKKDNGVCLALYGDGAANQGQVFETFNIAALWKLPCLFICENNLFGMGTSIHRASASTDFYTRGDYIPGILVDGWDVVSIREAGKFALEYCRSGNGPLVMELNGYRFFGHSVADPGLDYRTKEEIEEMREKRDPLNLLKDKVIDNGLLTEEEITSMDKEAKQVVETAQQAARAAPQPDLEECYSHVLTSDYQVRGADQSILVSQSARH